jgi:hypothetical protein
MQKIVRQIVHGEISISRSPTLLSLNQRHCPVDSFSTFPFPLVQASQKPGSNPPQPAMFRARTFFRNFERIISTFDPHLIRLQQIISSTSSYNSERFPS